MLPIFFSSDDDKTVCGDETPESGISPGSSLESIETIADDNGSSVLITDLLDDFDRDYRIDLNVSRDSGIDMSYPFNSSATVKDVIRSIESDYYEDFDLEYTGRLLPRSMTLRETCVPKNARVKTVERKIKVNVKDINGRQHVVDIKRSATLQELKNLLVSNQIAGLNPRFLLHGAEYGDTMTLRNCNIQKNSEFLVYNRCYGG